MAVMAYLAGLVTTPAALLGVVLGHAWWARLRRAQGASDAPLRLTVVIPPQPPTDLQREPRMNRVSYASKLGPSRALRGKPRR